MPTELEKIQHLKTKYRDAKRLYTVYAREGEEGRYTFTLIYGTDSKEKAVSYVHQKEAEGLFLIAYCARSQERSSRCVYVSGMQNTLATPPPLDGLSSPASPSLDGKEAPASPPPPNGKAPALRKEALATPRVQEG
jgi:hypothetical protein